MTLSKTIIASTLVLALTAPGLASAQNASSTSTRPAPSAGVGTRATTTSSMSTGTTTRTNIRAEIEARAAELRQNVTEARTAIQERQEAARQIITETRAEISANAESVRVTALARFGAGIETAINAIVGRLTAAVERLTMLADRLDDYVDDGSQAALKLEEARIDITAASESIIGVSSAMQTAVESDTPRSELPAIRTAIAAAQQAIITARDSLREVVASIRTGASATVDVSAQAEVNASTTN